MSIKEDFFDWLENEHHRIATRYRQLLYNEIVEAKKVMEFPEIIAQISNAFGTDMIDANKALDREKLASIVFNEPEKLKQLNSIVHPAVKKHFDNWIMQHQKFPVIVKEAAILFESGSYQNCDSIITITTPLEDRIARVMQRDNSSREQVLDRINAQWTDEQRAAKSNFIIENTDPQNAKSQLDEILKILKIQQNEA